MAWLLNLDLIRFFDFYLAVIFLLSTYRRVGQYRAVAGLALRAPGRWPRSWQAPVVHFFTLGRISPRQMVAAEVQKALLEASTLINSSMWWVTAQMGLRIAFGLALWVTYAVLS